MGGAYGVMQYLKKNSRKITLTSVRKIFDAKKYVDLTKTRRIATWNGRSVAYGASLFGCKCRIFIHSEVSEGRKRAMEKREVIR